MGEALFQDIRYAFRQFRQSPGFAVTAILTLALGIGANTALFTILNALVLRELPIKDPAGLIGISGRNAQGQLRLTPITSIDELDRVDGPLQDLCGHNGIFVVPVEVNSQPTQAALSFVTGGCFTTFGVTPIMGRPITDDDAPLTRPGRHVVVIGHRFWTRAFNGDPAVIGKTIRGEGLELTVVGVLPPGFGGLRADNHTELFVPFDTVFPVSKERRPGAAEILGRLRPGLTLAQAAGRLEAMWPALLEANVPATMQPTERADLLAATPRVERMGTGVSSYRNRYAGPLTMILGLTALLLLLACLNLGGLLLARLSARRSELAVRMALGGTSWRIGQQMLIDGLLLSICGAVLAVPMSFAIIAPLESYMSVPSLLTERSIAFDPDLGVLLVTALVGVGAGVLMTALPIWIALHRQGAAAFTWDRTIVRATSRWTRGLLVAQVALSAVMLIGAGLLARSVYLLQQVDPGLRADGVLVARVLPVPNGYNGIDNEAYYPALLDKLSGLPGVRSVGFGRAFPQRVSDVSALPIGFVGEPPGDVQAFLEITSPRFFETLGIPLLAGRLTSWSDNTRTRHVAVVSESLARALAPDGDVLNRRVRLGNDREHQDVVIVGVVANATQGNPRRSNPPVLYRPALQWTRYDISPTLVLATSGDIAPVTAGVRQVLKDAGREYVHDFAMLGDMFRRAPTSERMSAILASVVAGLAIVLVFIGVHGALAYAVSRRTREIGIHLAIGATPGIAARTVLRESVAVTLIGLAVGLPAAYLAGRALKALMFGVSEADPVTFIATAAFFLAIGIGAGIIPARRAAGVDPVVALRAE